MRKLVSFVIPTAFILWTLSACQQPGTTTTTADEKTPVETAGKSAVDDALSKAADLPPAAGPQGAAPQHPPMTKSVPTTIVVPEEVQGKWASVVLKIENKTTQAAVEQTVPLHSEYKIPETAFTIQVGDFLPQFTMDQGKITSVSNNDVNPGVQVKILDGEQEVYSGWLFKRFPDMHPFQDPRLAVTLVGYNAKAEG